MARKIAAMLLLSLVLVMSCAKSDTGLSKSQKSGGNIGDKTQLIIGLVPERNIFAQVERFKPLAEYLSKKIGLKVTLKIVPEYGDIIRDFVPLNLDGAFFGSFTYALAHARLGLEVLARPENLKGVSTYFGVIFVRRDSRIRTIKDMKGKRFAFVDKATTAGYLLPLAYFKQNGIKNYKAYFKETYFTGTHEDAIMDVLNKRADIGAAKNTEFDRMASADRRIKNELVILVSSPEVPENALAVRKDLDLTIKTRLKEALLRMNDEPEGREVLEKLGDRRFIETIEKDYEPVFKYAKDIGLDLATFDYMKEK
ncbi:MAG: phosphate/phosphite/phosphonate ABC transporter substrate-binding protein [Dissulfurispiraceae bacterium]